KGKYPGQGKKSQPDDRGSLKLENLDLSRVAADMRFRSATPLAGQVDLTLNFANDLSEGSGRVFVRGLKWGPSAVSPEIAGVVVMRNGIIEVSDVSGPFAGGTFRGRA